MNWGTGLRQLISFPRLDVRSCVAEGGTYEEGGCDDFIGILSRRYRDRQSRIIIKRKRKRRADRDGEDEGAAVVRTEVKGGGRDAQSPGAAAGG